LDLSARASWTIDLEPGRYVASLVFAWSAGPDLVEEDGVIGLLVSRSASLRVEPAPSCG
jgi:hypothetical protein